MDKTIEHFAAELAARINTLEAHHNGYTQAFHAVKRNTAGRWFRKSIGIFLEVISWLSVLASIGGIVAVSVLKGEAIHSLDKYLVTHIPGAGNEIVSLIETGALGMQALAGVAALLFVFIAYLLAKVRKRNNTITDLTDLLEHTLQTTADDLNKARQTQVEFIEWRVKEARKQTAEAAAAL